MPPANANKLTYDAIMYNNMYLTCRYRNNNYDACTSYKLPSGVSFKFTSYKQREKKDVFKRLKLISTSTICVRPAQGTKGSPEKLKKTGIV